MCTVTVVPLTDGFRLMCNRDDQLTRPHAVPARVHATRARWCVWPTDPLGGGTWIGANDAGLAMALLNRNPVSARRPTEARVTRGAIIPVLLGHASIDSALQQAISLDVASFAPFELIIVEKASVGIVSSDGRRTSVARSGLEHPLLCTSSSLGDDSVDGRRRRLFEQLVVADREAPLRGQARFHAHRWTHSPETSVLMSRPDAATVSRTVIDVTAKGVALAYDDLIAPSPVHTRVVTWESGSY